MRGGLRGRTVALSRAVLCLRDCVIRLLGSGGVGKYWMGYDSFVE